jgi:hypothetical protein
MVSHREEEKRMKIDRIVVVLAGAMTSTVCAACYVVHDPPPPAAPPAEVQPAPAPPPPPVADQPPPFRQRRTLAERERLALLRGTWRRQYGIAPAAGAPGATPAGGAATAPVDGGPAAAPTGPAGPPGCLDNTATTVPACALQPVDASCKATSTAAQRCQSFASPLYDPKVGAAAVACLNHLSSKQLCDPAQVAACAHTALLRACPDTETVAPLCQIAAGPCKVTEGECVGLLSGLGDKAQDMVAQCVAQGCGTGLEACVEGLK